MKGRLKVAGVRARGRAGGICALAVVASLTFASVASAARVYILGGTAGNPNPPTSLNYLGSSQENNQVELTPFTIVDGTLSLMLISDPGAGFMSADSPLDCPVASPSLTLCSSSNVLNLNPRSFGSASLSLGDGDDSVTMNESSGTVKIFAAPGPGDDRVVGGGLDDSMIWSPGADEFQGGGGTDSMSYSDWPNPPIGPISVSLDDVANDGLPGEGDNIHSDVEHISGSQSADEITGSDAANWISGGDGDDELYGGPGDDQLHGDPGGDLIVGGPGSDTIRADVVVRQGDDTILIRDGERDVVTNCGDGFDTVVADPIDEVAADCENVELPPGP